ncbi:hypothetical protein [Solimicrobium silvestre]|uniref:Uncharacterized protein n=1 Tax=Solimicrobium silvestre TaxID=2099400 RepID=A0A2S9GY72_9BURK|nr:hypothetical protein [Solimicrobium silvestre]PRC92650.1 hypothetical protein S2091_2705 [Solimicrobium silvestre]
MKSLHSETKSESFHSLSIPEYLQPAEKRIIALFNNTSIALTRKQIRDALGDMELSGVCGRVNSLITKNRLANRGERKDPKTRKSQGLVGLPVSVQFSLIGFAA